MGSVPKAPPPGPPGFRGRYWPYFQLPLLGTASCRTVQCCDMASCAVAQPLQCHARARSDEQEGLAGGDRADRLRGPAWVSFL